jgi:hypothetical protein
MDWFWKIWAPVMEKRISEAVVEEKLKVIINSAIFSCKAALEKEPDNWRHIISEHVIHDLNDMLEVLGSPLETRISEDK